MTSPFARRFRAYYDREMACGHWVDEGEMFAITPDDEMVCAECGDDSDADSGADDLATWARFASSQ